MVQDAIAIEEHGWASQPFVQLAYVAGKVLGDADVDEIAAIAGSAHGAGSGQHRQYVLFKRSGEGADVGDNGAVDNIDATIDRTGRALAGCQERPDPIVVHDNAAVSVVANIGAQRHMNEAGAGA